MPPCLIFEDEHLLVAHKPAGMNTHAPSPYAGEGFYEWLKQREPRWSRLAIIHRLDKETSGVMVFGKTAAANRSLTEQFTQHAIRKKYLLITDRPVTFSRLKIVSALTRTGDKYASRPLPAPGERAETDFQVVKREGAQTLLAALPVTGRTHQIRAQAAAAGFPILGDALYGGAAAARLHLHAAELILQHPVTGVEMKFASPVDFNADSRRALRESLLEAGETNAWRLIHGAADGWPGWQVERLGDFLLSQGERPLTEMQSEELRRQQEFYQARGVYHKILHRQVGKTSGPQASPHLAWGEAAPDAFAIRENGLAYELSFQEGYSIGLFLDQRENRRRWLKNAVTAEFPIFAPGVAGAEVLNAFAYTCGFSVCAARAGARVTSLDLSKKYLAWGRRNFALNGLDAARHDFIFGEVFDWLRRLAKKGRQFDALALDPPTFSQSKETGTFQAEKDYGRLVTAALPLLKPGGTLFASANSARLEPEKFLADITASIGTAKRNILRQQYVPQPPDFPISKNEPAYLKTVWLQVG